MPAEDEGSPARRGEFERALFRASEVAKALRILCDHGLAPDLVVAHPGWGEMAFVRSELPETPLLCYCEYFHRDRESDVDFDAEYPPADGNRHRLQLLRARELLSLHDMDHGLSPTHWQRAQFPELFRDKIEVLHDGIDTDLAQPNPQAELVVDGRVLRAGDPIVTFAARGLEPYRGIHPFLRCLPELQRRVPGVIVAIAGGDRVSYGITLPPGESYRARLMAELGERVDWSRVLFTGILPHASFLRLLQVSAVHTYLTYPFVLSWSLLEALSAGCCVIASRTPPVQEVIADGTNGLLVDFFDVSGLARTLADVLQRRIDAAPLRAAARRSVVEHYDLRRRCLPAGLALLDRLAAAGRQSELAAPHQ